ncbi:glucosaminidase domain-containing protein [Loigolactobacillus binensis]|uniref:Glucosaminidase domain-containing protein n=1 Tax=Loigolactobacillus binensis TaxID=2559922 RepID=A0ABW3EFD1_9LACO|nr:glucosaminidase domain-containing protein [Loigolactobacillus binensis]
MTRKNIKQRVATVTLAGFVLGTPFLMALPSVVSAATSASPQTTAKNAAQIAAQQDVLAGRPRGTSRDPAGNASYQADYTAEFTLGQTELHFGQVDADQDVMTQKTQGTSKHAARTIYYDQGYAAEFVPALASFRAGLIAGCAAGTAQVVAQNTDQLAAVYQAGYTAGYAQAQAQQKAAAKRRAAVKPTTRNDTKQATAVTAKSVAKPANNVATRSTIKPANTTGVKTVKNQHVLTDPAIHRQPMITPPVLNNTNGVLTSADNSGLFAAGMPVASHTEFIRSFAKDAQKIAQKKGLYASVMIAQAALESDWGTSTLSLAPNYNLFGVKGGYQNQSTLLATQEDNGLGQLYTTEANFKRYYNYKNALTDYADLLKGGPGLAANYYAGTWKQNAPTYQAATQALTGRYATDTKYNLKLNQIIATYHLTDYDQAQKASKPAAKYVNFMATLKRRPQLSPSYFSAFRQATIISSKPQLLRTPFIWYL